MIERLNQNVRDAKSPEHAPRKKEGPRNPKGRSMGPKRVVAIIDEEWARQVVIVEGRERKKLSVLRATVRQLADKAARGDSRAFALIMTMRQSAQAAKQSESKNLKLKMTIEEARKLYENSLKDPELRIEDVLPPTDTPRESSKPKVGSMAPKNVIALIDEELARQVVILEGRKQKKISIFRAAVRQLINKATRSDSRAFALMMTMRQSAYAAKQAESEELEILMINPDDSAEEAARKYYASIRRDRRDVS